MAGMPGMPHGGPRLDLPTSMSLGAAAAAAGLPATPRPDHMSQAAAAAAASNAAAAAAAAQAAAAAATNGPSSEKIKVRRLSGCTDRMGFFLKECLQCHFFRGDNCK